MTNQEIAEAFERVANFLEIKGELVFKINAYRRAAETLRPFRGDLASMSKSELLEIPGVGDAIAGKIQEIATTGKLELLEKLMLEIPIGLLEVLKVPNLGPKKTTRLWKELGITNIEELSTAAHSGKIRSLAGMGEKTETRILVGIEKMRKKPTNMPLHEALPLAELWCGRIAALPGIEQVEIAGSVRRWKTSVGDLDFVAATSNPQAASQAFLSLPDIASVNSRGESKISVQLSSGIAMQLWMQPKERFGSLLQFVTGSKEHNVHLREISQHKRLSLSERGFLDADGEETLCEQEETVYHTLGLPFIPPEMREDRGEIQAAIDGTLPQIVEEPNLLSDLHIHTDWSDGKGSIERMVCKALSRGLKLIAITDHSPTWKHIGSLTIESLERQREEIERIRSQYKHKITILHGAEVDIREDGSLDFSDDVLSGLDFVVASLHIALFQTPAEFTQRLLSAIHNPYVDMIAHPNGRENPRFQGADADWDAVFSAARDEHVALEINSNPYHLDLDEFRARQAAEMGIMLCINSDAHSEQKMDQIKFGVSTARRAGLTPHQILNCLPVEEQLKWIQKHHTAHRKGAKKS